MDIFSLRQKHPNFVYRGFEMQKENTDLLLNFNLSLDPNIKFQAKVKFKKLNQTAWKKIDSLNQDPTLKNLFYHLGLAEIPSYWKAAASPKIKIQNTGSYPTFTEKQLIFWKDLLIKGMGEFYFKNKIDFSKKDFLKIQAEKIEIEAPEEKPYQEKAISSKLENKKLLVPVGGGKDSATTLGILEKKKLSYDILLLAPHSPAAKNIAELMQKDGHCQEIIEVERQIDPKLIELNQAGYLNGHSPFSAYLAFLTIVVAYLYGHDLILLSNEASADEENTIFHGQKINHQYSKSSEFEKSFQNYAQRYLFNNVEKSPYYFSILRPLSELKITKILIQLAKNDHKFKKILSIFRSCNLGQKKGIWCHNCPKCAFVFTMFSAYLDPKFVSSEIFSENLFEKEALKEIFYELAGFRNKKPFECVGTFAETREALLLAEKKYLETENEMPKILKSLQTQIKKSRMDKDEKQ